jgi:hypothetical protein
MERCLDWAAPRSAGSQSNGHFTSAAEKGLKSVEGIGVWCLEIVTVEPDIVTESRKWRFPATKASSNRPLALAVGSTPRGAWT